MGDIVDLDHGRVRRYCGDRQIDNVAHVCGLSHYHRRRSERGPDGDGPCGAGPDSVASHASDAVLAGRTGTAARAASERPMIMRDIGRNPLSWPERAPHGALPLASASEHTRIV